MHILALSILGAFASYSNMPLLQPLESREVVPGLQVSLQDLDPVHCASLLLENDGEFDLRSLEKATNLQSLRIYGGRLEGFAALKGLRSLREIHFVGCGLTDIGWLSDLDHLAHVNLALNAIRETPPLGRLHNLEFLDLSWNSIDQIDGGTFSGPQGLRRVDLRNNPLPAQAPGGLRRLLGSDVLVLAGKTDVDRNPASTRRKQVLARCRVARYCLRYRLALYAELGGPQFEPVPVPDEITDAMAALDELGDDSYVTDLATLVACYSQMAAEDNPTGYPVASKTRIPDERGLHLTSSISALIERFGLKMDDRIHFGTITSGFLGDLISSSRECFGPSLALSDYVARWVPSVPNH